MTKYAKTICLANKEPTEEDNIVLISGWGKTSEGGSQSDILMKGIVSIISRQKCSILYEKAVKTITNQMICAGSLGKDTCQGDSGGKYMQIILINSFFNNFKMLTCFEIKGPVVINNNGTAELIGIVSWGLGCARPEFPGVYTNVAKLVPWITENSKNMITRYVHKCSSYLLIKKIIISYPNWRLVFLMIMIGQRRWNLCLVNACISHIS